MIRRLPLSCLCFFSLIFGPVSSLIGLDLYVQTSEGSRYLFEVSPEETFEQVQSMVDELFAMDAQQQNWSIEPWDSIPQPSDSQGQWMVTKNDVPKDFVQRASGRARDYFRPVDSKEKRDIYFIINTLANESPTTLWKSQMELEQAGNRVSDVHPLRFMLFIFSEEELKVGMHNIYSRKWVWENFVKGMKESFDQEQGHKNITDPMVEDLSKKLSINSNLIDPLIKEAKWKEFIQALVLNVPRQEGYDRYGI